MKAVLRTYSEIHTHIILSIQYFLSNEGRGAGLNGGTVVGTFLARI